MLTRVLASPMTAPNGKVVIKNYKGFDVVQVSDKPGAYILFDCKYNSFGKKNYQDMKDAKQAADDMYADRLQVAGFKMLARVLGLIR